MSCTLASECIPVELKTKHMKERKKRKKELINLRKREHFSMVLGNLLSFADAH